MCGAISGRGFRRGWCGGVRTGLRSLNLGSGSFLGEQAPQTAAPQWRQWCTRRRAWRAARRSETVNVGWLKQASPQMQPRGARGGQASCCGAATTAATLLRPRRRAVNGERQSMHAAAASSGTHSGGRVMASSSRAAACEPTTDCPPETRSSTVRPCGMAWHTVAVPGRRGGREGSRHYEKPGSVGCGGGANHPDEPSSRAGACDDAPRRWSRRARRPRRRAGTRAAGWRTCRGREGTHHCEEHGRGGGTPPN